jgi:hypothetical protein
MRLVLLSLLFSLSAPAAWQETKSGPFVVLTDASEKDARAALWQLEQFRFVFGETLGHKDLRTVWPITVVVSKGGTATLGFSRDGWVATWPAGSAPAPAFFKRLALILIEDNWPGRMPNRLEATFATLFSTLKPRWASRPRRPSAHAPGRCSSTC